MDLYLTHKDIHQAHYGLIISQNFLCRSPPQPILESDGSKIDLNPKKILAVYQNDNGIFAAAIEQGQKLQTSEAKGFNQALLLEYINSCQTETDRVVITQNKDLSDMIKQTAGEMGLKVIIFQ